MKIASVLILLVLSALGRSLSSPRCCFDHRTLESVDRSDIRRERIVRGAELTHWLMFFRLCFSAHAKPSDEVKGLQIGVKVNFAAFSILKSYSFRESRGGICLIFRIKTSSQY